MEQITITAGGEITTREIRQEKTNMGSLGEFIDFDINELDWCEKKRGKMNENANVRVTVIGSSSSDGRRGVSFAFANDISDKITSTGYIQFAVYKNRILFREAEQNKGFKVVVNKTTPSRYAKEYLPEATLSNYVPFVGNYKLQYDKFWGIYYIEREEK